MVAQLEALLSREHQPSAPFPIPAIDGEPPRYVVAQRGHDPGPARGDARRVGGGPAHHLGARRDRHELPRALDARRPRRPLRRDRRVPWHTLTQRDERLWTEEVVELFLDVGATGRSYAEVEWNPVNAVVDLWVDRPENRFDKEWNVAGSREPRPPRGKAAGRATGWTAVALLPWKALASKAPPGTALPPKPGDRWRFNVFRIERPGGPKEPEKDARFLAWSPDGEPELPRPPRLPGARLRRDVEARGALALALVPWRGETASRPRRRRRLHPATRRAAMAMGCTATVRVCGPDAAALPGSSAPRSTRSTASTG